LRYFAYFRTLQASVKTTSIKLVNPPKNSDSLKDRKSYKFRLLKAIKETIILTH